MCDAAYPRLHPPSDNLMQALMQASSMLTHLRKLVQSSRVGQPAPLPQRLNRRAPNALQANICKVLHLRKLLARHSITTKNLIRSLFTSASTIHPSSYASLVSKLLREPLLCKPTCVSLYSPAGLGSQPRSHKASTVAPPLPFRHTSMKCFTRASWYAAYPQLHPPSNLFRKPLVERQSTYTGASSNHAKNCVMQLIHICIDHPTSHASLS
jgi:hypothetical protein